MSISKIEMLKKLEHFLPIDYSRLKNVIGIDEMKVVDQLLEENLLFYDNIIPYGTMRELYFTSSGKILLFNEKNSEEIKTFKNLLEKELPEVSTEMVDKYISYSVLFTSSTVSILSISMFKKWLEK